MKHLDGNSTSLYDNGVRHNSFGESIIKGEALIVPIT